MPFIESKLTVKITDQQKEEIKRSWIRVLMWL